MEEIKSYPKGVTDPAGQRKAKIDKKKTKESPISKQSVSLISSQIIDIDRNDITFQQLRSLVEGKEVWKGDLKARLLKECADLCIGTRTFFNFFEKESAIDFIWNAHKLIEMAGYDIL